MFDDFCFHDFVVFLITPNSESRCFVGFPVYPMDEMAGQQWFVILHALHGQRLVFVGRNDRNMLRSTVDECFFCMCVLKCPMMCVLQI